MRAIYVDKHIPRVLLTKAYCTFVKGLREDTSFRGARWLRVKNLAFCI